MLFQGWQLFQRHSDRRVSFKLTQQGRKRLEHSCQLVKPSGAKLHLVQTLNECFKSCSGSIRTWTWNWLHRREMQLRSSLVWRQCSPVFLTHDGACQEVAGLGQKMLLSLHSWHVGYFLITKTNKDFTIIIAINCTLRYHFVVQCVAFLGNAVVCDLVERHFFFHALDASCCFQVVALDRRTRDNNDTSDVRLTPFLVADALESTWLECDSL